ncbi:CRISPR-associated endonuclease Cas2 [Roseospira navarrensis]|uniref:CRISPR-associated endoribonuclease Cas2 n=1 Tax=Roseospira navarrensis TaxID=140058 RepID=A0A7X2D4Q3_9PROT|nr:CRISPR-associated endonuclease Cas2 [Roseospira navarrensis]MQX38168.1 CRISPR-associated endonuclease Cas2 [Roseospira navarrensis]
MTSTTMLTVFCYDVVDDKARRRVARTLEDVAVRVQDSVFEAWMTAPQAARVFRAAREHLHDGDSLRVYAVSGDGLKRSHSVGPAPLLPREGYLIV